MKQVFPRFSNPTSMRILGDGFVCFNDVVTLFRPTTTVLRRTSAIPTAGLVGIALLTARELEGELCDDSAGVALCRDNLGLLLHLLFEPLKLLGVSIGVLYRTAVGECGGK